MDIQFLGAARQVTGSCYLLEAAGLRLLVDCGLFQERPYQERNWAAPPVPLHTIDFVLLTHAHLDHCGLLPRRVAQGLTAPVLCTAATRELARIVLLDSAEIQEEDAAFKRKRHARENRSGPYPEQPLYTKEEARRALQQLRPTGYDEPIALNRRVSVRFRDAGHILGSALVEVQVNGDGAARRIAFSGDLGLPNKPIIPDPSLVHDADYLVLESTYGDRDHDHAGPPEDRLAEIVAETVARGGSVIIPTFAIERAQELMFHFSRLMEQKRIPRLLVFLDSPMAVEATAVFPRHRESLDAEMRRMLDEGRSPFSFPSLKLIRTRSESKAMNALQGSAVIMAGSGMCTAGRIKHHLVQRISRPENTVLFVGYQAQGTLGRHIVDGAPEVRILGEMHPVRARIEQLDGFSAHADRTTLLRWAAHLAHPPRHVYLTHGEPEASAALQDALERDLKFECSAPAYLERASLT
ncbi:MAG: MBL fold metallo-hydrolase [Acidobacteria bacterium]|nr:MBL fold metallo-hydrolase [Acidobacteriota bacterium]